MSHKQLLKTALGCYEEPKEERITIQFRSPQRPFNKPVIGTSMLIGTEENLKSTEHWLIIFQDIKIDLINYFCEGIFLNSQWVRFVIKDTEQTAPSSEINHELFTARNQTIELYFNGKPSEDHSAPTVPKLTFLDGHLHPCKKLIKQTVKYIVERIIHSLFQACIDPHEFKQITGKEITWDYVNHLEILAEDTLSEVIDELTRDITKNVHYDIYNLSDSEKCARFHVKESKKTEADSQHWLACII